MQEATVCRKCAETDCRKLTWNICLWWGTPCSCDRRPPGVCPPPLSRRRWRASLRSSPAPWAPSESWSLPCRGGTSPSSPRQRASDGPPTPSCKRCGHCCHSRTCQHKRCLCHRENISKWSCSDGVSASRRRTCSKPRDTFSPATPPGRSDTRPGIGSLCAHHFQTPGPWSQKQKGNPRLSGGLWFGANHRAPPGSVSPQGRAETRLERDGFGSFQQELHTIKTGFSLTG